MSFYDRVNRTLREQGCKQQFILNEKKVRVLEPIPSSEGELKDFHAALTKAIESLSKPQITPRPLGNFHVKQWLTRKSFRADCPTCGGERTFQHMLSPSKGVYLWICNTDPFHQHGVRPEDLDSEHPDWKNQPIQS